MLRIVVEGSTDKIIVDTFLRKMNLSSNDYRSIVANGKFNINKLISQLSSNEKEQTIILIDLDEVNVPDAKQKAQKQLGNPAIDVYCAIPTIESWLLADKQVILHYATDSETKNLIERLPLVEEITFPKNLLRSILGIAKDDVGMFHDHIKDILEKINIDRAIIRSFSLHDFLSGVFKKLNIKNPLLEQAYSRNMSRDIFCNLLREVSSKDSIVFKVSSGEIYTAVDMIEQIESGTEIGKEYASDILRIARDFLARHAKKGEKI